jgi:sugar O-acyltransferase (sialic acid O-acetyltransferase NeuD family)
MRLVVYGASGHGSVVADTATAAGYDVIGFVDDREEVAGTEHAGLPVLGGRDVALEQARTHGDRVVVAIGDNAVRRRIAEALRDHGVEVVSVVHPRATISPRATLCAGTVVFAGVVVQPGASVGRDCILNTGTTVDHDCSLGDGVHLSPGVHLGGTVVVGDESHLGVGVCVRNNLSIGARTVVGVGAAVVADLPDDVVAYGVPARVQRTRR